MAKTWYVYAIYIDKTCTKVRYFGKGSGNRIITTLKPDKSNSAKSNFLRTNPGAFAKIIYDNLTETEAFEIENKLICKSRRHNLMLVNSNTGHSKPRLSSIRKLKKLPYQATPVILYHFGTKKSWAFASVNKAAEFTANILGKTKGQMSNALILTKNKTKPSILGFSAFLPEDFTDIEISSRCDSNHI